MATKKKVQYGIVVISTMSRKVNWVTGTDNLHNMAYWNAGEDAMLGTKSYMESITMGLNANGYNAYVVIVPDYMHPFNPEEEN